ncbi:MAG: ATP cone domain-containing protein [Candidatus Aenigmatarchaeota archaeon]
MPRILVRKRGGYLEDFDEDKIKKSLIKAGCTEKDAEKIASSIKDWAERQPGKIVNSVEIERQVVEHTREKHKDVLITFLAYGRNKIKPIKRIFNKKDIAQMLTSLFVIIQIYVIESVSVPIWQALSVLFISIFTNMLILWLIEGKEMWKHLISGFVVVTILSAIIGSILQENLSSIIVAMSVGLPVSAMVDVLKG